MTQPVTSARVAVDAMGGDYGLCVAVEGALAACRDLGLRVLLVGPAPKLAEQVRRLGGEHLQARVVDAPDVVSMGERVTRSALKRRSSIQVGMDAVRRGEADAFFSAGNTAACWTIAKLVLSK